MLPQVRTPAGLSILGPFLGVKGKLDCSPWMACRDLHSCRHVDMGASHCRGYSVSLLHFHIIIQPKAQGVRILVDLWKFLA